MKTLICSHVLALVALFFSGRAMATEQIHLTTFDSDPPISVICEAILRVAYHRIGIELVLDPLPGERALLSASKGIADGSLYRIVGFEKDYPSLIPVPVPLYEVEFVVFTKGPRFRVDGWPSLSSHTIGYRHGYKIIETRTRGWKADPATTQTSLYNKLEEGRTEVVVDDRRSGTYALKQLGITDVFVLDQPLMRTRFYHFLHRKNADLVPRIQAVLTEMARTHEIERIEREELSKLGMPAR